MARQSIVLAGVFCVALMGGAGFVLANAAQPNTAAADVAFDEIRFPQDHWAPGLLQLVKDGPSVLPRDFDVKMAPPTSNSSAETRADLDAMLVMQGKERTPVQVAKILQENNLPSPTENFTVDGLFDPVKYPETNKLLDIVNKEIGFFIMREKEHYQRARPTQLESKLTTLFPIPPHASYPSGHAGQSYAVALVLAEMNPARRDEYLQHSIAIGHRREIAGVHYPADSTAGRALSTTVIAALLQDPKIQPLVAKAKEEFKTK